jgi:AcrR family transcriptional regulator
MSGSKISEDATVGKGERTRQAILLRAVSLASVQGLERLSIGGLASDLGLSKSGLFAHFGSKQELQLAVAGAARQIFVESVIEPAGDAREGVERLVALCDRYFRYSEQRIFPGGCFFFAATSEFGGQRGTVRDEVVAQMKAWLALLERNIGAAVEQADLARGVDVPSLAFEVSAFLTAANWRSVALADARAYTSGRRAIAQRLRAAGATPRALRSLG